MISAKARAVGSGRLLKESEYDSKAKIKPVTRIDPDSLIRLIRRYLALSGPVNH